MEYPFYAEYPAVYRDAHGEERTVIRNDGSWLRMTVRGVELADGTPSSFEPPDDMDDVDLTEFTLHRGNNYRDLCGYDLDYTVPVPMIVDGSSEDGMLDIHVSRGLPVERLGLDHDTLAIRLQFRGADYFGSGKSGMFEYELLEIQAALPDGVYMKACINCLFSDYSPYGCSSFGDMACYRDDKVAYLAIRTKMDMLMGRAKATERVQETYLCPQFERRVPGTGYRG